jgi:TetR/AcrR family transcriptional regulator, transcriptional repressor for nem operon
MARTREFDPDAVLDRAVDLFWSQGYRGLSMDQVVRETGVSRSSIYSVYPGKHELFMACLERYRETIVPETLGGLERPDAGLPEIKAYFRGVVDDLASEEGRRGCLLVNSAAELSAEDPEVAEVVQAYLDHLRERFLAALRNARRAGQIPASENLSARARLLVATAAGLIVIGKPAPDRRLLRSVVSAALAGLDGAR